MTRSQAASVQWGERRCECCEEEGFAADIGRIVEEDRGGV